MVMLFEEGKKLSFITTALDYDLKRTYVDQLVLDWSFMQALYESAKQMT